MPVLGDVAKVKQRADWLKKDIPIAVFDTSFLVAFSQKQWWALIAANELDKINPLTLGFPEKIFQEYSGMYNSKKTDEYGNRLATIDPEIIKATEFKSVWFATSDDQSADLQDKFSNTPKAVNGRTPGLVDESLLEFTLQAIESNSLVFVLSADQDICSTVEQYCDKYDNIRVMSPYTMFRQLPETSLFSLLITGEALGQIKKSADSSSNYLMVLRDIEICKERAFDLGISVQKRGVCERFRNDSNSYSSAIIKLPKITDSKIVSRIKDAAMQGACSYIVNDSKNLEFFVKKEEKQFKMEGRKRTLDSVITAIPEAWARIDLNWLKALNRQAYDQVHSLASLYKVNLKE